MRVGGEKEFLKIVFLTGFFFLLIFAVWIMTTQKKWQATPPNEKETETWQTMKGIFSETGNFIPQIKEALKARYEKL